MVIEGSWSDLQTRGILVVRSFLSPAEVESLAASYASSVASVLAARAAAAPSDEATRASRRPQVMAGRASYAPSPGAVNASYLTVAVSGEAIESVRHKIEEMLAAIRASTDLRVDAVSTHGTFFPTEYSKLGWHTDTKTFDQWQDHYNLLNFWITVVKPDPKRSGLAVIPFDRLERVSPEIERAVYRRGAAAIQGGSLKTEIDGRAVDLPFPVEPDTIAEAPDLVAGDVLITRCDVLHKTQDAETHRVALSIKAYGLQSLVSAGELLTAGPAKRKRIRDFPRVYEWFLAAFWLSGRSRISLEEFNTSMERVMRRELKAVILCYAARVALPLLVSWKRMGRWMRESVHVSRPSFRTE